MKKLLVFLLIFVVGKVAFDRITQSQTAKNVDKSMVRIAEEMNQKLPQTTEFMRIERVEYADHFMRFFGTLAEGQQLTEESKTTAQRQLKSMYCGNAAFIKANVGVEYSFTKVGIKSINEKVRAETWSTRVRPENCQ